MANNKGLHYEDLALSYLQQQGLQLIERNFRCKTGEIDLIMKKSAELIFVEVKYRANNHFGGALAAVTRQKQQKLLRTARWYLQQKELSNAACRIDVLAIEGQPPYQYHWLKNAVTS